MSKTAEVKELLKEAHEEGDISLQSLQVLNTVDIGAAIQAGLGVGADDVTASEVVLVTVMPDDSFSIEGAGHTQLVRDGHNLVLDAIKGSKQGGGTLCHTRYLNGEVLFPYRKLDEAVMMDESNYNPNKGTPLYDQSVVLLGTVLAKTKEFSESGIPVRSITLIITDGADQHSVHSQPKDVAALVGDMLRTENHIIAAMGIDDGGHTDFKKVFSEMGIREDWILTPGKSKSEIRKAFEVVSQSFVRASQTAASFSKQALGGFGN